MDVEKSNISGKVLPPPPLWLGSRNPAMKADKIKTNRRFTHSYSINMEDEGFQGVTPCNTLWVVVIQQERMQEKVLLFDMCATVVLHASAVIF